MGYVSRYPECVHNFVKKWCRELDDDELAKICNECFGTDFTRKKMNSFRYNHGYNNGRRNWHTREELLEMNYPNGMYDYIVEHSWGVSSKDLAEQVNELFGTNFNASKMKSFCQRYGIKRGNAGWFQKGREPGNKGRKQAEYCSPEALERSRKTQFKKGHRPVNEMPVGSIRTNSDGDTFIKISMEGEMWERWKPYHRYLWEQHHGPIPEGMQVTFKNHDKADLRIDNLILISKAETTTLAKKGWWSLEDPEAFETAVNIVRLQQAAIKRRKNAKRTVD